MFLLQPDGFLTEERKAQDPDQGFSTFFTETGKATPSPLMWQTSSNSLPPQAKANTYHELSTVISSPMSSMRSAPVLTAAFSTPNR